MVKIYKKKKIEEHLLSNQEGNINHDGEELKIGENRNIETFGYRKSKKTNSCS
jgi:hypothetical protein